MAEYVAGRGTTALGIIGTVLGGIATAATGGGMLNCGARSYEASGACMHDIDTAERLAQKDAEIARLQSEKYADSVGLGVYKYFDGQLKELREQQNNKWTDQAVINANLSNGLTTVSAQAKTTAEIVAQITRTAVPSSAICNFGCGCGCTGNSRNI